MKNVINDLTPNRFSFYAHWKAYILILVAIIGIIIIVSWWYSNLLQYNQEQSTSISPTPTKAAPLVQEAKNDQVKLEKETLAEPANLENLRDLARAYILTEDFEKARDTYLQTLSLDPDNSDLHRELGNVYVQLQNTESAVQAYEESIRLDPINNNSYIELADIYKIRIPDNKKVISIYNQAIKQNPNNVIYRIHFASFYEQIQEKELALQQYHYVLSLEPDNTVAKQKVEQLSGN